MGERVKDIPGIGRFTAGARQELRSGQSIADQRQLAVDVAQFLAALQRIDPAGGPPPGTQNFFRGGDLTVYDSETRNALAVLEGRIDTRAAWEVWEAALAAKWSGPVVWVHGDVSALNSVGGKRPIERDHRFWLLMRGRPGL